MQTSTIIVTLSISLLISFKISAQQNELNAMKTEDEQAIYQSIDKFLEAWNKGDANGAASLYTEDGVRVGAMGDIQHGCAEITAAYEKLMHTTMPGAKANQEKGVIRMLSPELAIWQGGLEIIKPDGSPPMKGYVVQIMKKINGRWLILEAHPKFFPPPPTPK